jgi:hypothetical protein
MALKRCQCKHELIKAPIRMDRTGKAGRRSRHQRIYCCNDQVFLMAAPWQISVIQINNQMMLMKSKNEYLRSVFFRC